jgi:hypothetical protein
MEVLLAIAVALALGFIAGLIVHVRAGNGVFSRIRMHVALIVFVLSLSFFLYWIIGFNFWALTILPVISLIIVLLLVRNSISRLLEIKQK